MHMVKHLMLKEMKARNSKNVVLSPLSLNVLLNMIAAGTTGATLELMLRLLGSESVEEINNKSCEILQTANYTGEDGPTVTSINAVWVDKSHPVKASYAELLKRIYDCEANTNCDFANKGDEVLNDINSWAEVASRGLIKKVLNCINPITKFVRANALYFKGVWFEPFNPDSTQTEQFFLLDETITRVPFLTSWDDYAYGSFDGYKVLRVPYENRANTSFSMYFILPDDNKGLPNLLETFKFCSGQRALEFVLKRTDLEVVQIPKFKVAYQADMEETMESMGLEIPFKSNQLDFAEMIDAPEDLPPLSSKIIQKAFIEIDENGTEASAVTIDEVMGYSLINEPPPPRPKFVANHPFMFAIKEDVSGLVFFTGMVLNPEQSDE